MDKELNFKMTVTKEQFVDNNGQVREYYACVADIYGKKIKVSVHDNDKSLFKYLLEGKFDEKDEVGQDIPF